MSRRRFLIRTAAMTAAGGMLGGRVRAQQDFPSRTITIVAPFPPGSTTDISARLIAQKIAGPLGKPVIVENKPGANGSIGMQAAGFLGMTVEMLEKTYGHHSPTFQRVAADAVTKRSA